MTNIRLCINLDKKKKKEKEAKNDLLKLSCSLTYCTKCQEIKKFITLRNILINLIIILSNTLLSVELNLDIKFCVSIML